MNYKDEHPIYNYLALVFSDRVSYLNERHIELNTPSGRKFKYELSAYPVSAGVTPQGAMSLAKRIFREKYRYCEWDRNHPHVDIEKEITTKIVEFILGVAEAIRRMDARKPRLFAFWGIFSGGQLVEEFPYRDRTEAERRLAKLLAENP